MRLPKIKNIEKIYLYIIMMAALIFDRKSLYTTAIFGYGKSFAIFIIILIPLFFILILKDKFNKKMVIGTIIYILLMLIPSLIKLDFQGYYFTTITYVLCMFLIVSNYSLKIIIKALNNSILFISKYSIFVYFIVAPILKLIGTSAPIIANSEGFKLYNYGLCFFPVVGSTRNYGLYSEPGMFQIYILLALIISTFTAIKNKKINVILLSITMFTTGSIAGIIVWGIIMLLLLPKLFEGMKTLTKNQVLKSMFLLFAIMLTISAIYITNSDKIINEINSMKDKLIRKDNMSNISRMQSITVVTKEFVKSPLYGTKFLDIMKIVKYGNTNTITSIFAVFGILFGIVNLTLIYRFCKLFKNNIYITLGIFIAILTSLSNQFIFGTIIYVLIVMIGIKSFMLKEEINYENTLDSK